MERSSPLALTAVPHFPPDGETVWRLADAVWTAPVGLGLCDERLRFIRVNEALADFDGVPVAEHHADDALARLPAEFSEGLQRARSGEAHDVEFVSRGRAIRLKLHSILRPGDRVAIGIGIVALDVTDERKAIQQIAEANRFIASLLADSRAKDVALSGLVDSVHAGVLVVDPGGRIRQANRAAERLLRRSRGTLVGSRLDEGTSGLAAASLLAEAAETSDFCHGELHIDADGGFVALAADASALRDAEGRVTEVVVSVRDVTGERRDLEMARSSLDFQQRVIGIVGHDLRNPLATIIGSIRLLRRDAWLTRAAVASLDRMDRSAARMARLISDLLDYARTHAPGGLPVVLTRGDLHVICGDSVDECRAAHPASVIVLEKSGDGTGAWDHDRIEQAVTNLIVNAIQHGGGDPVRVRCIGSAEKVVAIQVHNAGPLIPAEVLPDLFRAYRRGIRGHSKTPAGLGLGLYIVAQIAAAHGGRAYAESSAAAGTVFTLELPRSGLAASN